VTSAITGAGSVTAVELETPPVAALLHGERLRSVSLECRLLLAAARLALRDAGLPRDVAAVRPDGLGIVVATRHAGLHDYVELFLAGTEGDRPRVNPARGPQTGLNAPAAELSIRLRAAGPNATVSNGAVGGLDALRYAADRLAAGHAQAMLVCGVDAVPAIVRGEQGRMPHGDSAAVVVLEATRLARLRGATPRALLGGVATAFSPTDDAAEAEARAVHEALRAAGTDGGEVEAWEAGGADSANGGGAVARLANAAARLARHDATGPLLVRAGDGGAAGAAVLHGDGDRES
jgi:3-oxoacyl-(acyl-carrier-protein) synthase